MTRPLVTIYSRPGCHLCEEMKAIVTSLGAVMPMAVEEIDISSDPRLEERYGPEIPVLMIDGTKIAKYLITEGELTRVLRGRWSR